MVVTVHKAKTQLSKLIEKVLSGEEVIIARRDVPLIRLELIKKTGGYGSMKGLIRYMAPDFNEPLPDFAEYMETAEEAKKNSSKKKK